MPLNVLALAEKEELNYKYSALQVYNARGRYSILNYSVLGFMTSISTGRSKWREIM